MPYQFTEEEKEAIRQKYRENIQIINSYINPDGSRKQFEVKLDMDGLNKKLNDPNYGYFHKKSLEIIEKEAKKKEIQDRLDKKFAYLKDKNHPERYVMQRFMHDELIPSDDPEAEAYNEEKIKMYCLHPEAVAQRKFQEMFNVNVKQLAEIAKNSDEDAKMAAWASNDVNMAKAFEAFEAYGTLSKFPKDMLTPEMNEYLDSVSRNYEMMIDTTEKLFKVKDVDLVLPALINDNQEDILNLSSFGEDHPELAALVSKKNPGPVGLTMADSKEKYNTFFKGLEKTNIDLEKDGALTEYYVENVGGKEKKVSVQKWINGKLDGKPELKKMTPEQVAGFKKIFKIDYTKEEGYKEPDFPEKFKEPPFKAVRNEIAFRYATKYNIPMHKVDEQGFNLIAESIKGGVKERLFNTTSRQYKNLIQTMKDYDNKNHVGYHDSMPVKLAANDYLIHKGVRTRDEAMILPSPAKERSLLCFDLIEGYQKAEPENEKKLVPGSRFVKMPENKIVREPAFPEDDPMFLEDDDFDFHNKTFDNIKENKIDQEKEKEPVEPELKI